MCITRYIVQRDLVYIPNPEREASLSRILYWSLIFVNASSIAPRARVLLRSVCILRVNKSVATHSFDPHVRGNRYYCGPSSWGIMSDSER